MKCIVGIDEVGRGALAGPVVVAVAAIICPPREIVQQKFGTLKDSKKLTAAQRERWYAHFAKHPKISFTVARVYPRQIEKRNISGAANLAALRAYRRLIVDKDFAEAAYSIHNIFLDGGLFLGGKKYQQKIFHRNAKTVVKGDEKISVVAIASIIAKVHRDRFMVKLAKQYPGYGLDIHKGYGTKSHREALLKIGTSKVHRRTFIS